MRRHILGIVSLLLVVGGAVLYLRGGLSAAAQTTTNGCLRAGLLLAAMWLAWPQVGDLATRVPRWLAWTLLALALVVVFKPKLITYFLPVAAALIVLHWLGLLLKPKPK